MKKDFNNIEHTKPIELFIFLLALLLIFFFCIKVQFLLFPKLISILSSISITLISFFLLKKKLVKKSSFVLLDDKVKCNNALIHFDEIKSFKMHFMKGAGLQLNLKNGDTIRFSSNDNFCNSDKFVEFCLTLNKQLSKYNDGVIVKKKSFMETKWGYYTLISMAILVVGIFIHSIITGKELRIGAFGLMIVSLSTLWSSYKISKTHNP
jgi:hypothetical protein